MSKDWNILKDKEIINLIIGDKVIIDDFLLTYNMPRMSGPDICNFGCKLGLNMDYQNNKKQSRWMYMEKVLDYVIVNDIVNLFFKELLGLKRFRNIANVEYYTSPNNLYLDLIYGLMNRINEVLYFDKCHIDYNFEAWQFALIDDEDDIKIETASIDKIDKAYIKRLQKEINAAIENGDYESSITKSRTLLEEIIIYGIEQKGVLPNGNGNIITLYNQFKRLYGLQQENGLDNRINGLLSGLEKVINSIANMRNESSDSHGAGEKRVMVERQHAILMSNASITISEFLLSTINKTIA